MPRIANGYPGASGPATRRGVLIYLRVSTEEQAESGNSLAEQERWVREKFEKRLGLPILGVYADEGASAYKDDEKRENFWRMIERAKSDPQVGIITVDEESRSYRNRYKAAALKAELLEYGVTVQTAKSDYDPRTLAGLWMQAIEETMAHAGSLQNREYTLRAMAGNVRSRDPQTGWCYKNGGVPPLGYRAVRVEPRAHPAIIDEETADRLIALARQTREHYETGRGRKGAGSTYLLTGENLDGEPIFRCAACGGHLIGSANGSGGKRRRKYVCAEARYSGGCETVWVDAERLEAAVLDYLRRHYLTPDFARAVAEEVRRRQAAQNDDDPAAEPRRRLRETERQLANVRQVIPAGGDPQALAAELNRLVATARTLQQQIAAAEQRRATPTISEEQVRTWLDEALRIVDGTDVEPLRRLVRASLRRATLHPSRRQVLVEFVPDPRAEWHPAALLWSEKRDLLAPPPGFEPGSHG